MSKPIIGPPAGEPKIKLPMQKTRTGIQLYRGIQ